MSVRERQHFRFGHRAQPEDVTTTIPMQQTSSGLDDEPLLLGFPAEFAEDDEDDDEPPVPRSRVQLVVLRRADSVAGIALILAGFAAAASLWFPWIKREDFGLALVQRAVEAGGGVRARDDDRRRRLTRDRLRARVDGDQRRGEVDGPAPRRA